MNREPTNKNVTGQGDGFTKANIDNQDHTTKIERITSALMGPAGLNRFEAERIGEHTLNSTVAIIRSRYGARLSQEWETVPTRYCARGVRVLRYWLLPSEPEAT